MFATIQGKMLLIFLGFLALLAAGFVGSHVILQQQADDGLIVNLAGRQRMLTQKMTKESMQLAQASQADDRTRVAELEDQVLSTARVFEMTLFALRDGGAAPVNLEMTRMRQAPASTGELRQQLEKVSSLWTPFQASVQKLAQTEGVDEAALANISASNVQLLKEMNRAVGMMQHEAEAKVESLYLLQGGALFCGFVLVAFGAWVARTTISGPIVALSAAAESMSTGNLNVDLQLKGTREVEQLGASFDRMRASLVAAFGGGINATDDDL